MNIREERPDDVEEIWQVNSEAFETSAEANLVNSLRDSGCTFVSLVAEIEGKIVGHILFTPVKLSGNGNTLKLMGLAPMSVLKPFQNKGIGSELVKAGLELLKSQGYDAVVVLGHPEYYPRFNFVPSITYDIKSEYDVPDDVFMILELAPGSLDNHKGIVKYHQAFNSVE
jgi:putative acetyltransferase